MIFLLDEDVDVAVGVYLSGTHDVRYARTLFGIQTKDDINVAYARAQTAVLVTGDKPLARTLRQSHKAACLHLFDLGTLELARVTELLPVIEAEHRLVGGRFWMQIGSTQYVVAR